MPKASKKKSVNFGLFGRAVERRGDALSAESAESEPDSREEVDPPASAEDTEIAVLVVYDPADKAKADKLVSVLQPRLSVSVGTASKAAKAAREAEEADVALLLVSRKLQQNESLVRAAAAKLPNALVPVLVEAEMGAQKEWGGELSWNMANELYFSFCEPAKSELSDLIRLIQAKVNGEHPKQAWDVFISHEWGSRKLGYPVHKKAQQIAKLLEAEKLRVWLDVKEMAGGVNASMSRGIEGSRIFLVLATKDYMGKVNSGDHADNCLKEFRYANDKRFDRTVVAALEAEMANFATVWEGEFKMALAKQKPVNVCTFSETAIKRLAKVIRDRIKVPQASGDLLPRMRELRPILNPYNSEIQANINAEHFTAGTRGWIFDAVVDWYRSESPVFVLAGDGGVGKSVIMAAICCRDDVFGGTQQEVQQLRKSARVRGSRHSGKWERPEIRVAAYHFFRYGESKAASPKEALLSIAWQLCRSVPGFAEKLDDLDLVFLREMALADIFQSLLVGPLRSITTNQARQVVVLDALDECEESGLLLNSVIQAWESDMPGWLSLIASTRPEGHIMRALKNNGTDLKVLKLKEDQNYRDIELHVKHLLHDMKEVVEQKDLEASAQILAGRSEGLFLWVSFLRKTLKNAQSAKGDGSLLTKEDLERKDIIPDGLGRMFEIYFKRLQAKVGGAETYAMLLAPIVAAREPLGPTQLSALLGPTDSEAFAVVDKASNLLYKGGDGRVGLLHKRMADWLTGDLSGDLRVDIDEGHKRLAAYCRDHSKDDEFALRHAVYHLGTSGDKPGAFDLLNEFSWVQKAISVGEENEAQRRATMGTLLRDCANLGLTFAHDTDTPRLLSKALNALGRDPNELASQVLARVGIHEDDREHSLAKSVREPSGPWLKPLRPSLPHPHDPLQHVLMGRGHRVTSVALYRDLVISGSRGDTVSVWNATTGELQRVLEGHSLTVNSVAVNSDRVVSGSRDNTVCVWSVFSGELQHKLTGHISWVNGVALDGDVLVSGSEDKTVRIWDAKEGKQRHVLKGHRSGVTSVAVDGEYVASGSEDKTVCIWSAAKGDLKWELKGHSLAVTSVAIDGDRVVSGSEDKTVRVWSVAKGDPECRLAGHSLAVTSVAVDGVRVVSGSLDKTVRIWNAAKKELELVLVGHSELVRSVAVQRDRVVSGSSDKTVRIWMTTRDKAHHMLEDHPFGVESVVVDGDRVVSEDWSEEVRVWNAKTGEALDKSELATFSGGSGEGLVLPVEVEDETHVQLAGGTGFTTDNAIKSKTRVGDVIVVGDAGGMVHISPVAPASRLTTRSRVRLE